MTPAPLHFCGERLMLDPSGGLFWPARRILVVADLHLEKGSSAAAGGQLLPPWDTADTLERLSALLRRYEPISVIALGDSFHDRGAAARVPPRELARLRTMTQAVAFTWILGNHDPHPPAGLAGDAAADLVLGRLHFRHQSLGGRGDGEICGHHHPKAQVAVRGTTVTRPCFVTDPVRLMLPALGAYTGGLDVRSPAIRSLYPRGGRVFLVGRERLFSFTLDQIREPRPLGEMAEDQGPLPPHHGVTDASAARPRI